MQERERKQRDKLARASTQQQDEKLKGKALKKSKKAMAKGLGGLEQGKQGRADDRDRKGEGYGMANWFGSEFRVSSSVVGSSGADTGEVRARLQAEREAEVERERAAFMSSKVCRVNLAYPSARGREVCILAWCGARQRMIL